MTAWVVSSAVPVSAATGVPKEKVKKNNFNFFFKISFLVQFPIEHFVAGSIKTASFIHTWQRLY